MLPRFSYQRASSPDDAVDGENQLHCILGGDACYIVHPSDPAAALVALDAVVRIAGSRRGRAGSHRRDAR